MQKSIAANKRLTLCHRCFQAGGVAAAGGRDVEPVAGETQSRRAPDSAGSADDEGQTIRWHEETAPEK